MSEIVPFGPDFDLFVRVAAHPEDFRQASTFWAHQRRLVDLMSRGFICFSACDPNTKIELTSQGREQLEAWRSVNWSEQKFQPPTYGFGNFLFPCGISPAVLKEFLLLDLLKDDCQYPSSSCSREHWTQQGKNLLSEMCKQLPKRIVKLVLDWQFLPYPSNARASKVIPIIRLIPRKEWSILIPTFSNYPNFSYLVDFIGK